MLIKFLFYLFFLTGFVFANEGKNLYGLNIPNSSLNIGGYLDMTYDDMRRDDFLFEDIAMLFSSNSDHFDLLGEIELSHISLEGKSSIHSDVDVNVERLQVSYNINDNDSLVFGRFNSDVGFWNQAPITILQDTTTTPHVEQYVFPQATTGMMYKKRINSEERLSFTLQYNKDLAHQEETLKIDKHIALAYVFESDEFSWGISLGTYRDNNHINSHYAGLSVEYDNDLISIQSELFTEEDTVHQGKPYSGYVQSVWHLFDKQDMVMRLEAYYDKKNDLKEEIYLLGYVYRPFSNLSLKGEYVYHSKLPLNRFVYSLSVLF